MPALKKFRFKENIRQIHSKPRTGYPFTKTQNIRIIMLTAGTGMKLAGRKRRAYSFQFIGSHAHTDTGSANKNAESPLVFKQLIRYFERTVGIIAAYRLLRSQVEDIMPLFL